MFGTQLTFQIKIYIRKLVPILPQVIYLIFRNMKHLKNKLESINDADYIDNNAGAVINETMVTNFPLTTHYRTLSYSVDGYSDKLDAFFSLRNNTLVFTFSDNKQETLLADETIRSVHCLGNYIALVFDFHLLAYDIKDQAISSTGFKKFEIDELIQGLAYEANIYIYTSSSVYLCIMECARLFRTNIRRITRLGWFGQFFTRSTSIIDISTQGTYIYVLYTLKFSIYSSEKIVCDVPLKKSYIHIHIENNMVVLTDCQGTRDYFSRNVFITSRRPSVMLNISQALYENGTGVLLANQHNEDRIVYILQTLGLVSDRLMRSPDNFETFKVSHPESISISAKYIIVKCINESVLYRRITLSEHIMNTRNVSIFDMLSDIDSTMYALEIFESTNDIRFVIGIRNIHGMYKYLRCIIEGISNGCAVAIRRMENVCSNVESISKDYLLRKKSRLGDSIVEFLKDLRYVSECLSFWKLTISEGLNFSFNDLLFEDEVKKSAVFSLKCKIPEFNTYLNIDTLLLGKIIGECDSAEGYKTLMLVRDYARIDYRSLLHYFSKNEFYLGCIDILAKIPGSIEGFSDFLENAVQCTCSRKILEQFDTFKIDLYLEILLAKYLRGEELGIYECCKFIAEDGYGVDKSIRNILDLNSSHVENFLERKFDSSYTLDILDCVWKYFLSNRNYEKCVDSMIRIARDKPMDINSRIQYLLKARSIDSMAVGNLIAFTNIQRILVERGVINDRMGLIPSESLFNDYTFPDHADLSLVIIYLSNNDDNLMKRNLWRQVLSRYSLDSFKLFCRNNFGEVYGVLDFLIVVDAVDHIASLDMFYRYGFVDIERGLLTLVRDSRMRSRVERLLQVIQKHYGGDSDLYINIREQANFTSRNLQG